MILFGEREYNIDSTINMTHGYKPFKYISPISQAPNLS